MMNSIDDGKDPELLFCLWSYIDAVVHECDPGSIFYGPGHALLARLQALRYGDLTSIRDGMTTETRIHVGSTHAVAGQN